MENVIVKVSYVNYAWGKVECDLKITDKGNIYYTENLTSATAKIQLKQWKALFIPRINSVNNATLTMTTQPGRTMDAGVITVSLENGVVLSTDLDKRMKSNNPDAQFISSMMTKLLAIFRFNSKYLVGQTFYLDKDMNWKTKTISFSEDGLMQCSHCQKHVF